VKLYELTGSFNEIFNLLETDEDFNYEALEDTLQALEGAIEQKADSVARMIKSLEKTAEAYASEAKRLSDKAKSTENKARWLKDYLLQAMEATAKDKIQTGIGTVSRRKSPPSVSILDIEKIPRTYWFTPPPPPPQLDKKMVLDALKQGADIPGVELHQGYHIRIA
jgi:hypothetical protein